MNPAALTVLPVVGGGALLIAGICTIYIAFSGKGRSPLLGASMALLVSPVLLALVLWLAFSLWQAAQDPSAPVPAEIEIAEVLFDELRFADGCELVVYRMTEASRADLQQRGLAKLATAQARRDRPSLDSYASWRKTDEKTDLRGTDCIELPAELSERIHRARQSSYVTEGRESDLMADPDSGLLVYGYDSR